MAFATHPFAEADSPQQVDRSRLQGTGPNTLQHMLSGLPFQYDAIDAISMEDVGQKQAGWPSSDDRHLGSHFHCPCSQIGHGYKQGEVMKYGKRISYGPSSLRPLSRGEQSAKAARYIKTSYLGRMLAAAQEDISARLVKALGSPHGLA
jgi:hypothetical protein